MADRTVLDEIAGEPSAPVAPDWPTRCAALEADGIAARKRVAALEAENAALRERNEKLVEGLRGMVSAYTWHETAPTPYVTFESNQLRISAQSAALSFARVLLRGGPDAG